MAEDYVVREMRNRPTSVFKTIGGYGHVKTGEATFKKGCLTFDANGCQLCPELVRTLFCALQYFPKCPVNKITHALMCGFTLEDWKDAATMAGIPILRDESVPSGTIEFRGNSRSLWRLLTGRQTKVICRIVNMGGGNG